MTNNRMQAAKITTPLGTMITGAVEEGICFLDFEDGSLLKHNIELSRKLSVREVSSQDSPLFEQLSIELREYFTGDRREFGVPPAIRGTPFQEAVWNILLSIPYGERRSYKEVAEARGNGNAVRAAARAIGANRILILVPCHRVIGANGSLTGYSAGLERKKHLLELEKKGRRV